MIVTLAFLQGLWVNAYSRTGCPLHKGARQGVVGVKSTPCSTCQAAYPAHGWLSGSFLITQKHYLGQDHPAIPQTLGLSFLLFPLPRMLFLPVSFPQPTLNVT